MGANYLGIKNIERYDDEGDRSRSLSVNNWTTGFSIAQGLGEKLSLGFGFRFLSLDLADVKGSGLTFNTGVAYKASPALTFGAAMRNYGPKLKSGEMLYPLPSVLRLGASYQSSFITFGVDYDDDGKFYYGLNCKISEILAIRGGYKDIPGSAGGAGISLGIGFYQKMRDLAYLSYFDYSVVSYGELGFVHGFSLGIKF